MTHSIKLDLYQEVTNRMISLLEKGVFPWRCTWSKYGNPRNFVTGRTYNGINRILMSLTPNPVPYFMTFKQIKEKGGKVKKGAKARCSLKQRVIISLLTFYTFYVLFQILNSINRSFGVHKLLIIRALSFA